MKYLKNLWYVCCAVFISGCLGQIDLQYSKNPINDISPVSLKLNTPSQSASNTAAIEIQADGSPGASIQLFSDPLCLHSLESKSAPSGTTVFTLTLEDFGKYNFYALQTKDSKTSTCTSAPLTYSYLPPKITALTSPLGLSDVGVVPDIQIAAQSIVKNSLVTFYSAPGCLSPSGAGSAPEIQNSATISLSLSSDGQYEYYANQSINGVTSECSSVKLSYALRRTCDSSDLAATGYARGTGSKLDPFIICSPTQFNRIGSQASDWNKSFTILESLNFNSIPVSRIGGDSCSIAQFTGEIDGNNKELSNITINGTTYAGVFGCFNGVIKNLKFRDISLTGTSYVGIIGSAGVDDSLNTVARVSNIHVENATIQGNKYVGTIAGYAINAELDKNIVTNLTMTPTGTTPQWFGGIAGFVEKLSIINDNTVSISVAGSVGTHIGGIVGILKQSTINFNRSSGSIIQRQYSGGIAGQITAPGSEPGCLSFSDNTSSISFPFSVAPRNTYIGGLVGQLTRCDAKKSSASGNIDAKEYLGGAFGAINSSNIKAISATGNVSTTTGFAGGLVGNAESSFIAKSSATGKIQCSDGGFAIGGFVGYLNNSEIINSYSSGDVSNDWLDSTGTGIGVSQAGKVSYFYTSSTALRTEVKGFLGKEFGAASTYINNYYKATATASPVNGINMVEAKTLAELQIPSTFNGWNFNFVWTIDLAQTPVLNTNRLGGTFYVSTAGSDANEGSFTNPWKTLTFAASEATAGDTIIVRGGQYEEIFSITESGKENLPIVFKNYSGEIAHLKFPTTHPIDDIFPVIRISNASNIIIDGFEISDITTSAKDLEPIGILVTGHGQNITLQNLKIRDIRQSHVDGNALGILVQGTDALGLKNVRILNNQISNLETGWSETIAVNGNVEGFLIEGNYLHDNNNIGIDIIGYEDTCSSCPTELNRARNGIVRSNTILNSTSLANPSYAGEPGAVGIYVDGGKDIIIELNRLEGNDWGIELSSEKPGNFFSNNVIVRNNIISKSKLSGIVFGGYTATRSGCVDCHIVNNTFFNNDLHNSGGSFGEIHLQHRNTNVNIWNNIFYAETSPILVKQTGTSNTGINFDNNLYYLAPGKTPLWRLNGQSYTTFADFKAAGFETNGAFAKPLMVGEPDGDFRPLPNSPTVGTGKMLPTGIVGTVAYGNTSRSNGIKIDIGAHEY